MVRPTLMQVPNSNTISARSADEPHYSLIIGYGRRSPFKLEMLNEDLMACC
jgi:hypothetical protein